jgi:transcriptional regulator with XRE-family HTH domain
MPLSRVVQVQRSLAANLRRLRTRDGLTQEQLAERAGLGPVHIRNIERGVENVTLATLVALADAFNVLPGQLLRKAVLQPLRPGRPPSRASSVRKKSPKA